MMLLTRDIKLVIKEMLEDTRYTNDLLFLQRLFSYIPLFVYGTQQRTFSLSSMLDNYPRVGVGHTVNADFYLAKCDNEPVALKTEKELKGRVYGEVYQVPPSVIADFDRCLCKGVHFHRSMVPISFWCPETKEGDSQIYKSEAFMYIGIQGQWEAALARKSAKPMTPLITKDGPVYRFFAQDDVVPEYQMLI